MIYSLLLELGEMAVIIVRRIRRFVQEYYNKLEMEPFSCMLDG